MCKGSANVWWVSASLAGGFPDRSRGHLLNANRRLTGKGWVGVWLGGVGLGRGLVGRGWSGYGLGRAG